MDMECKEEVRMFLSGTRMKMSLANILFCKRGTAIPVQVSKPELL